ncbi:MAG TPA: hypothetical protein VFT87_03280 [Candidatus Saccharimonadales bacterium]|nr:hypothetical protein [Candidatus Saccharimonadales bacterium]
MEPVELSPLGTHVALLLQRIQKNAQPQGHTLHVGGTAKDIYFAYEQLRNAADYTQQHLLLRTAIERFLRRTLVLGRPGPARALARDLVIELTNARYIANDSVPIATLKAINHFVAQYTNFYRAAIAYHGVSSDTAKRWTYHIASVAIERLLQPQPVQDIFVDFAYRHYLQAINRRDFAELADHQFGPAVFCAMQQAICNADKATTLSCWVSLTCSHTKNLSDFVNACLVIDEFFDSPATNKLSRLINRYGASIRAIHELLQRQPAIDLHNSQHFLNELETTTIENYDATQKRLLHSIKRALLFIGLTKLLIGLCLEVPLDILLFGTVAIVPLALTIAIPLVYLLSATYSLRRPSARNTKTILDYAQRILYRTTTPVVYRLRPMLNQNRTVLNTVYGVAIAAVLVFVGWILTRLGFHVVHGLIFFVFLSITSLVRFRIVQSAREFEIVDRQQSTFGLVSDLVYLPFIHLGQWLSDSYRQVNLMAHFLDLAIEMPLKTMLRALRTWVEFIREKREEV